MRAFSGVPRDDVRWTPTDPETLDLGGWTVAVIGGTGGLGRSIARLLAKRGADVTVVGQTFRDEGVPRLSFVKADLSRMAEARRVGRELPAGLDLVVLTTGIFAAPKREETVEGLERDMAISYLSRIVLLRELAPRLRSEGARKPRVFVMGFPGTQTKGPALDDLNAERSYDAMGVHMVTVVGNEALVLDAARRYPHAAFFGLNPGLIATDIRANFMGRDTLKYRVSEWLIARLAPSAEQYAARIAPLLVSPDLDGLTGTLFNSKGRAIHPSPPLTEPYVAGLLSASERLVDRALATAVPAEQPAPVA